MVIHIPDVDSPPTPSGGPRKGLKIGGKTIPTPYLIGGVAVILLGYLYYKKKQSSSTNATAPASTGDTSQGPGVDYSQSGYDLGYQTGLAQSGGGAVGSGSTGLDPTDLASIISALQPTTSTGNTTGTTGLSGTNTGGTQAPGQPITINIGGGAPTSNPAPGTNITPAQGGGTLAPTTSGHTPFNASTTPIATQIQDVRSGIITPSQLGPQARLVYNAGYSNLAQYQAAQLAKKVPSGAPPTAFM